jgi:hypothetical protein
MMQLNLLEKLKIPSNQLYIQEFVAWLALDCNLIICVL